MCAFPVQALEDSNALQFLSDELREKLLQTLLERRLKQFTLDVCTTLINLCALSSLIVPVLLGNDSKL